MGLQEGEIKMVPIEDLIELSYTTNGTIKPKYTFFVPGYQRGYRWTDTEVIQLLKDIQEFTENKLMNNAQLYCLQPIVVKKIDLSDPRLLDRRIEGDKIYELIDGQQRLTTIYLILKWLNARFKQEYQKELFQVVFETRMDSEEYLKNLNSEQKDKYIDYYHLYNAYKYIDCWFSEKTKNQKHIGELETVILKYVKPIWYEIPFESSGVEVFRSLNVGKIRLDNFELIKALFLSKSNYENNILNSELFEIAYDWDYISKSLMDDKFWYFISNTNLEKHQRIEYLFEIQSRTFNDSTISNDDKLRTFLLFQKQFRSSNNRMRLWKDFKRLYMTIYSWYEDRYLHHMIGYLITEKKNDKDQVISLIDDLRNKSLKSDSPSFRAHVRIKIQKSLKINLEKAEYGKHSKTIYNALLLFNIATLLQDKKSNVFFNFSEFKDKSWDIEHIKSVSSDKPAKRKGQLKWINGILWYMTGIHKVDKENARKLLKDDDLNICMELIKLSNAEVIDDIEFSNIYDRILKHFGEEFNDDVDNSLANLTLLDENTNRSYGNSIFPVKRKTIIELETKGGFVPVCTKNVFLKLYNDRATNHFLWSEEDGLKYKGFIVNSVSNLLNNDYE